MSWLGHRKFFFMPVANVTYKLALAIYSTSIKLWATGVADLQQTWKEFSIDIRNEVLHALGKTDKTGLWYFQESILWPQFLHFLLLSLLEENKNLLWWYLLLVTGSKLLQKVVCSWFHVFCLHQNHIYTDLPYPHLLGAVSQSYMKCCLLGYSPHRALIRNSQLSSCGIF